MEYDIVGEFECDYNLKDMVVFRDETGSAHVITVEDYKRLRNLKPRKQYAKKVA